ncbi:MAG: HAD family phosphatase [Candidatus Latescibacteria bacterium]|nr:HAD family phosphatase [Candidatus Latescibacterota bacterium]
MIRAILWDNDGVLVDTEGLYFQAGHEVLATQGVELTHKDFAEQSLKKGLSVFDFLPDQNAELIEQLRLKRNARYSALLAEGVQIVDGVVETLETFYGRVQMGIVTGSRRDHFDIVHAKTNLLPFFDFVLAREDYEEAKPHPDAYLTAMRLHGLQPDDCVVVEDSERGCVAAAAAGLRVLAVPNELSKYGDFSSAYKILNSVRDVANEIEKLD